MLQNPTFLRVVTFADNNGMTAADIDNYTDAQYENVMFSNTGGVRPPTDGTQVWQIKKALRVLFKRRRIATRIAQIKQWVENNGIPVELVEYLGGREVVVRFTGEI